jgi:hypothetical protein
MIGFGYFLKQGFVRLVTINGENTNENILNFFTVLEEFTAKYHETIKRIA